MLPEIGRGIGVGSAGCPVRALGSTPTATAMVARAIRKNRILYTSRKHGFSCNKSFWTGRGDILAAVGAKAKMHHSYRTLMAVRTEVLIRLPNGQQSRYHGKHRSEVVPVERSAKLPGAGVPTQNFKHVLLSGRGRALSMPDFQKIAETMSSWTHGGLNTLRSASEMQVGE